MFDILVIRILLHACKNWNNFSGTCKAFNIGQLNAQYFVTLRVKNEDLYKMKKTSAQSHRICILSTHNCTTVKQKWSWRALQFSSEMEIK
jgi:hypothetical protein